MEKASKFILTKNNQFLIANKPNGLQSVKSEEQATSFQQILSAYSRHELYPVHRIDQPVSGAMLFANHKKGFQKLSKMMQDYSVDRYYLAFVKNKPSEEIGTLVHYLRKSVKDRKMFAFNKPLHHTKEAKLQYKIIASLDTYHLLLIKLETGRHHQIRTQFAAIKSPVKGDVKYGARRSNKDKSIDLHSWHLSFDHPITKKRVTCFSPLK